MYFKFMLKDVTNIEMKRSHPSALVLKESFSRCTWAVRSLLCQASGRIRNLSGDLATGKGQVCLCFRNRPFHYFIA